MNSKEARKLFSGYLEGELSAEEEEALRRRFAESPDAQREYRAFEATVELLRAIPKEEAPPEMTEAIMRQMRRFKVTGRSPLLEEPRRWSWPGVDIGMGRALAWAAMLALGFVAGMAFLNVLADRDPGTSVVQSESAEPGAADNASLNLALEGVATPLDSEGTQSPPWEQFEVPSDRPLRQVGTGNERPSIVF